MKQRIAGFQCNAAGLPDSFGLYDYRQEHDACGIGFIARMDAQPQHQIVRDAIQILVNLEHRGAVGGDKSTGDGAGLLLQVPHAFFEAKAKEINIKLPPATEYGVGMVFVPIDEKLREKCEAAFAEKIEEEGLEVLGWRDVPVQSELLGKLSLMTMPIFRQVFVGRGKVPLEKLELKLYVSRRLFEREVESWTDADYSQCYIPSLSRFTINYKGLLTGTQLKTFYEDLADERFASAFALVHQRYSTNTLPTWHLAQPFRYLAHNGEINTLRGNVNQMKARGAVLRSDFLGEDAEKIKPLIVENGSDSACFDNALEVLVACGRSIPHAMMMMIPEAWGNRFHMSEDKRAFYEYHAAIMEPWDGPASISFTDGRRYIGAVLDRNGLRPSRYTVTRDGVIIMASETGVLEVEPQNVLRRGRLQPGKMFLVDLKEHRIVSDSELKGKIIRQKPYRHWVRDNRIDLRGLQGAFEVPEEDPQVLLRKQHAFGYSDEELRMVLAPMASKGQEAIGSMGNDTAPAVLSTRPQLLFSYFKQLFAQVTNPPIDPLREELVMSLMNFVGRQPNVLEESPQHFRRLKIPHPILTPEDLDKLRDAKHPDIVAKEIDILFPAGGTGKDLEEALEGVFEQAERHIDSGATILVLTDKNVDNERMPIPSLLAVSGLHHHLIRRDRRTSAGIVIDTGEAREVMHFALLIGYGASGICPRIAFSTIKQMADSKMLEKHLDAEEASDRYITAIKKGLLKTFSRMGISTIRSYHCAQIFEAVGLSTKLIDRYFTNTASRVQGIGLDEIARETAVRHAVAFPRRGRPKQLLHPGGFYHIRKGGEQHMWTPECIHLLQFATRANDYSIFKKFCEESNKQTQNLAALRGLIQLKKGKPIPIDEVEPVEKITRRFVTAAMSFGSISREAHEAMAIAMNRVGGRSNSGEGGEDPARYIPLPNGDSKRSAIKQAASGRFGVTIHYLNNADELQIKMAQGAKPGEGGHLPGHKVSEEIARVRHTTPGVSLISPPPHHDIYSIEDLAQLIFDLKMSNPGANVSVKLVSEVGVGTVASGVAKAKADLVLISGTEGGTGASPLTSIKHAGLPWELGLAETQQSLVANHLRDRITVQVDGQLKTGRDLAIAALLGAEEYGFGTAALICLGCVMMRKCHQNTCPVGVATQDERLRRRFTGMADYVERFMKFVAQDLREYMAELGFRTVDEMVGRVDMLEFGPALEHHKTRGLDLSAILTVPEDPHKIGLHKVRNQEHAVHEAFDQELIKLAQPALEKGEPVKIDLPVRNTHRTIGATLSSEIARKYGEEGLPEDTIQIALAGSAGQSLGAFLAPGVSIRVTGDANDYVGKGLSGGKITIVAPPESSYVPHENIIAGNVILYGATSGELYLQGIVGERFCIRNSGANAVVEGVGDHGCEYMTGGRVVVLGPTGYNFAAGMSGGIAYVYDLTETFETRCNLDMVDLESVWHEEDLAELKGLIENHYRYTKSAVARSILDDWQAHYPKFVKVMPIEYRKVLERLRSEEHRDSETVRVTEEV